MQTSTYVHPHVPDKAAKAHKAKNRDAVDNTHTHKTVQTHWHHKAPNSTQVSFNNHSTCQMHMTVTQQRSAVNTAP